MILKIHNKDLWVTQQAEIAQRDDAETGEAFLAFMQHWCDRAEAVMEECDPVFLYPIDALRDTLESTQDAIGALPVGWLGQLLLTICTHWEYGSDRLFESMSPLEKRFCADTMVVLQADMDRKAQEVPDGPPG